MSLNKHTNLRIVAVLLFVLAMPGMASTQEAIESAAELDKAKQAYDAIAHAAAENNERRATLEQNIQAFATTVEKARAELQKSETQRRDVRLKIAQHKVLIDALKKQIDAVSTTRSFYQSLLEDQRTGLTTFVRYIAIRQIEVADTGPVIGSSILRQMLRGSLGDMVERDLGQQALLAARQRFLSEISSFMTENDRAMQRLTDMNTQLTTEVNGLYTQYDQLQNQTNDAAQIIDTSWKQKTLNEEELKEVQAETTDVYAQVSAMQESLMRINQELKDKRVAQLQKDLNDLITQKKILEAKRDVIVGKQQTIADLEDAKIKAYTQAVAAVNTDKNQYKRVEDLKLKITNKEQEFEDATAGMPLSGSGTDSTDRVKQTATAAAILTELNRMKEKMDLLKQGIPDTAADDYISHEQLWLVAKDQLDALQSQSKDINADIAKLAVKISDNQATIETVKNQPFVLDPVAGLGGSGFLWPVHGPITATFHDPDYQRVFHVPHQAIDIATKQGTAVHSTADGVVFKVRLGGAKGYTYVLIGHQNGYASLYGHLSQVFVKDGDMVSAGQIIGLSGGEPGTPGAGPMTTGSHLHFEMMLNSVHFNPLEVLGQ